MIKRDLVKLRNINIEAKHGYYDREKVNGQRFIVNLICELENGVGKSDMLNGTVNYEELRKIISEVLANDPRALIETLAIEICERVLAYPNVYSANVSISKPDVWDNCLPEVEIYRTR